MAESNNSDLAALDRILLRLSGTSNENLPNVLISLIPKLIPLGNNELLRRKVIEVSTEIIRRVKLGSVKLPLRIFPEIIHANLLPFAPSIGIGLMDAIHSVNCIIDVDTDSLKSLLEAVLSHQHLSFLSNSTVYYLLQYADSILVPLSALPANQREQLEIIIGDYFMDILLLRDLQLEGAVVGSIPAGMSDKRRSRLGLRKRYLDAVGLQQLKIKVLNYFTRICLDSIHPFLCFCAAIIAKSDSDHSVSLKGIYLLNLINDKSNLMWDDKFDTTAQIVRFAFHNRGLLSSTILSAERTGLSSDIITNTLREILRNWVSVSPRPPRELIVQLLKAYSKREFDGLSSEALERITILLLEVQCVDIGIFSCDIISTASSTVSLHASLVDCIWALLRRFSSSGPTNSGSVSEFRMASYKLLAIMVHHSVPGVTEDPNLLIELLKLADYDEQSAGTPLHKVLQELRERNSFGLDSDHRTMVAEQLENLRRSQRASSRLLYLQWTKRIFGVTSNFLVSLINFSGDANEMIANYIERQFQDLEEYVCGSGDMTDQLSSPFHETVSLDKIITSAVTAVTSFNQLDRISRGLQRIVRIAALALLQKDRNSSRPFCGSACHPLVALQVRQHFDSILDLSSAAVLLSWLVKVWSSVRLSDGKEEQLIFSNIGLSLFLEAEPGSLRDAWGRGSYGAEFIQTSCVLGFAAVANASIGTKTSLESVEELIKISVKKADRTLQLLSMFGMVRVLSGFQQSQQQESQSIEITNLLSINQKLINQNITSPEIYASPLTSFQALSVVSLLAAESLRTKEAPPYWQHSMTIFLEAFTGLVNALSLSADDNGGSNFNQQVLLNTLEALTIMQELSIQFPPSYQEVSFVTLPIDSLSADHFLHLIKLHLSKSLALTRDSACILKTTFDIVDNIKVEWKQDIRLPFVSAETLVLVICREKFASGDETIYQRLAHELAVKLLHNNESAAASTAVSNSSPATESQQLKEEKRAKELQMSVAILLVLSKHLRELFPAGKPISFTFIDHCLQLLLEILRDSSGILSDLCTMALNHLHRECEQITLDRFVDLGPGMAKFKNVGDFIAQECLATITRRKRKAQPLGFDASSRGHGARPVERPAAETANDREAAHTIEIPIPVTNDATGIRDALMEAASRMASDQYNVAMDGVTGNSANSSNLAEAIDATENGYGAYQKLCQIARRTGDSAVVMMVLAQIRQDITLAEGSSAALYAHYRPLTTPMTVERVLALVPALYMAKYDPISSIRDIMVRIWKDLFRQSKFAFEQELVTACQAAIFNYLTSQMLNPMWREREAAAFGLEALMINRSWAVIEPHCGDLLSKCFKLVDDLRESTRKAAMRAFKSLINHILRACDSNESGMDIARRTMDLVLPILLTQGILSPALEARGFSFGLLLKLIDQASVDATSAAGKALEPWLDRLVDALVESISALEPQMLSYLQFHSSSLMQPSSSSSSSESAISGGGSSSGGGGSNALSRMQAQEEWERMRIELAQHSPMHEALQKCLRLVHYDLLPKVANTLFQHLRSGVGLPSRVAAADSVSYLAEQYPALLGGTIGPQVMSLLGNLLSERPRLEITLKKAMYNAYGVLSKVVPEAALEAEVERLLIRYQELAALTAPPASAMIEYTGALRDKDLEAAMVTCVKYLLKRSGDRLSKDRQRMNTLWIPLIAMALLGTYDCSTDHNGNISATTNAAAATAGTNASTATAPVAANIAQEWQEVLSLLVDMSGLGSRLAATQRAKDTLLSYTTLFLLDLSWERRQQALQVLSHDIFGAGRAQNLTNVISAAAEEDTNNRLVVLFAAVVVQLTYSGNQMCWQGQHLAVEVLPSLLKKLLPFIDTRWTTTHGEEEDIAFSILRHPLLNLNKTSSSNAASGVKWSVPQTSILQHKADTMKELQQQLRDFARQQHPAHVDQELVFLLSNNASTDSTMNLYVSGKGSYVHIPFLVTLLLQQATRYGGGRDNELHETYRITVAKALNQLPWSEILPHINASATDIATSSKDDDDQVLSVIQTLVRYAGFAVDKTAVSEQQHMKSAATVSAPETTDANTNTKSNTASSFAPPTSTSSSASTGSVGSNKRAATAGSGSFSSAAMFGSRYGSSSTTNVESRPKKVARTMDTSTNNNINSNTNSGSNVAHSSVANNSANATASIIMLKSPSSSPVFRMHSLQALASIYQALTPSSSSTLTDYTQELIPIITTMISREVWSVKAAVLQWLAAVVHSISMTISQVHLIMKTVQVALEELKYAQVKLRGLDVFHQALSGTNRSLLFSEQPQETAGSSSTSASSVVDSIIRPCLRKMASDTTAEVLESVAKLQQRLA